MSGKKSNKQQTNHINFDKEILLKEYELNMSDHDRKEKMAWLASTLYFTFCLAVISFILGNDNINRISAELNCLTKWVIICSMIIIFICVILFVGYQYDRKNKSNNNIYEMQEYFKRNVKNDKIYCLLKKIYNREQPPDYAKFSIIFLLWLFFLIKVVLMLIVFFT